MLHLEEWDDLDQDFSNSLSGVTEALRASTLRLPVVGAAKVESMIVPLSVRERERSLTMWFTVSSIGLF